MTIAIIVAMARDGAIGKNGDLIWHIGADLRRFKELTMGHPIIMGRRTWESLPGGALPGRRNVVLTRTDGYDTPGAEQARSLDEALALCRDADRVFILGGGRVYAEALPLADELDVTMIDADCPDADTHFPAIDPATWHLTSESERAETKSGLGYRFCRFRRVSNE